MKISKKIYGILLSLAVVLIAYVAISRAFGWYTNVDELGKIDAETKDFSFVYKIDDDEEINRTEYEVTNLTFFDIDNYYDEETKEGQDELLYLNNMAVHIELTLENTSDSEVSCTVTFASTEVANNTSAAYVGGIVSAEEIDFVKDTSHLKIEDYMTTGSNVYSNTSMSAKSETVIHIYIFGVQKNDTAKNEDFLGSSYKYNFTLTIESICLESEPSIVESSN